MGFESIKQYFGFLGAFIVIVGTMLTMILVFSYPIGTNQYEGVVSKMFITNHDCYIVVNSEAFSVSLSDYAKINVGDTVRFEAGRPLLNPNLIASNIVIMETK